MLACLALMDDAPWLVAYPKSWEVPLASWLNWVADGVVPVLQPLFRAIAAVLDAPMRALRTALAWLPWPAVMMAVTALAFRAGGKRLALFAVAALAYILLAGYWRASMNTLALVLLAVPISLIGGFILGVVGYRIPQIRLFIDAALDLMQTVPAFAYLIPLLLLFGFGPVVGLIASAIFALPPMVRNTMLGLELVPKAIREAGTMSGCTRRQRFWHVEIPAAVPQLLVGLNQTTNAALSMVIVAAIIGGFEDIGWEVLSSMRKAEFGQSLLSGAVIALLAILTDRIMRGFARGGATSVKGRQRFYHVAVAAILTAVLVAILVPGMISPPELGVRVRVSVLNEALLGLVRDHADTLEAVKNAVLYGLMLPLRIGVTGSASPAIWGLTLTPALKWGYAAAVLLAGVLLALRFGWRPAIALSVAAALLFYGFQGFPWPALIALVGLLAWSAAGPRVAAFSLAGLAFILLTGLWVPFMQSAYLCALAVLLCVIIGGALGLWAAHNDRVSATLQPINDALQTMPQFVFLIPALMFFKVGDFTALIAVMLYAIVPPIRYVEHGIRHVAPEVIEAARQMGATPGQLLWHVKLPLALPVVMLGVNQTIMSALSMLAIAALVGTRDLGQQVYVALGKADAGLGLIAGLAIAIVAMISDRIIQNWAKRATGGK
jgi:glycine betaine/proline transport system permease protein